MNLSASEIARFREILERKEAELDQVLRERGGIAIERSADPMDEIQYASERDLAIGNVDRETTLLRNVRAALRRQHEGSFGECVECEEAISAKRLAAVPWAPLCIGCQNAADQDSGEQANRLNESISFAA